MWEWCTSEKKVAILRESGACGCPHSHIESSLFCQICTTPTQIAGVLEGVKSLKALKALKTRKAPNGFSPHELPPRFNPTNLKARWLDG